MEVLPITRITKEQREWLDKKKDKTGESGAVIIRALIQHEINKTRLKK